MAGDERAAMTFRTVEYGPYQITVMEDNQPGYAHGPLLLVSIVGPGLPTLRLTEQGPEPLRDDDTPGPLTSHGTKGQGICVFGRGKGDGPRLGREGDE